MHHDSDKYRLLIENLPDAFAYHQIVIADTGTPVDYIFLEVNAAFEEMTGLKRTDVIGKKVTEVHPQITESAFDWISVYGQVAQGGDAMHFEKYFEPSQHWYEVSVYRDKPGYFVTVFRNISKHRETQEKLENQRDLLQRYLDTTDTIMVTLDRTGNITMINRYGLNLLEYTEENLIGKNWYEIALPQPEGMEKIYQVHQQIISGNMENVSYYENDILTATGSRRTIAWRNNHLFGNKGEFVGILSSGQDITERKLLEQELTRSEERFHKMLSLVPDLISIHDADMNIVYSNWNGFVAVPEEKRILNTKCYKTYMGLDQICPNCQAVTVLQTGEPFQKEVELFEGTWVDLRVIPILGDDHTVEFFAEWVRDITDRKRSEKEIAAQQKLLEGIMDNVSDILSIQHPDHSIERYNRAGYDLLGMSPEEVWGKKCHHLIGQSRECEECATSRALQSGKLEQIERYFPQMGIHFDCRANPVFEDGKIVWVVQHLRDITEHKKAEAALKLQASERAAVDAFTSSVSHDLQAPLRRIEGFSEALLEECSDEISEKARDYLRRIIRQIESMHERTDALLKLSSVVSHEIVHEEVNLSGLVRSCLEKRCCAEPDRQVETVIMPDMMARGDVKLLSIVLENLLENAWKFSVNLEKARIECGSVLKDDRTVYFVKDNGVGFDQQRAAEIFDPFKKLHGEADYPGIGIGLNIAYRIISRHGGEMWAEGEVGKGACFYFTLP